MTKTYTAVFASNNDTLPRRYMELTITAKDHNDMVRQAKSLACPDGYHYVGTRDTNTWHHQPRV